MVFYTPYLFVYDSGSVQIVIPEYLSMPPQSYCESERGRVFVHSGGSMSRGSYAGVFKIRGSRGFIYSPPKSRVLNNRAIFERF